MNKKPLISIITISYNSCLTIEDTILSVINQTYPHIEYIVIDGGSKDGTVDIIKRYENKISYWISEPDKGIYYAMNKGIAATTGEWINFINCGDSFYDKNVIARLFKDSIGENYSVVYGNTVFQYSDHTEIEANRQYGNYKFMPACHQSIFCRTHYMKQFMFDTRYQRTLISSTNSISPITSICIKISLLPYSTLWEVYRLLISTCVTKNLFVLKRKNFSNAIF